MQLPILNPQFHTAIIAITFLLLFIISFKKRTDKALFPSEITQELKGLAILTIIFGHIGYFLDSNDKFLFPLSIVSGMGVNLFLFLSGYGLTKSTITKPLSYIQFYRKRLSRLFIPMWIVLTLLLLLDWQVLGITYNLTEIIKNYFGFFPVADIYTSVNSVLWYFTFITFYYLLYPFVSFKKLIFIAPLLFYIATDLLLKQLLSVNENLQTPLINKDVLTLYQLHTFAFPLGMFFALLPIYSKKLSLNKPYQSLLNVLRNHPLLVNITLLGLLLYIFSYTAVNSKVGESKLMEQVVSNITMLSIVLVFIIKRFSLKAFSILGIYSYEIYLIHWPLIYRYDFLYQFLPASVATILYLIILLFLGYLLQKLTEKIVRTIKL